MQLFTSVRPYSACQRPFSLLQTLAFHLGNLSSGPIVALLNNTSTGSLVSVRSRYVHLQNLDILAQGLFYESPNSEQHGTLQTCIHALKLLIKSNYLQIMAFNVVVTLSK